MLDTALEQDSGEIEQILYLAATEPAPFNHRHRMEAARLLHDGGQPKLAYQLLADIDHSQLNDEDFSIFTIQYAQLLLALDETKAALDFLHQPRVSQISPWQPQQERATISMLRGYGRIINNQGMAALRDLSHAEALLSGPVRTPLRQAIWELLIHTPRAQLQQERDGTLTTTDEPTLRGWLELALLCRDYDSSPAQQVANLSRWQRQWSGHPARLSLPPAARLLLAPPQQAQQIALFLPLSGQLAEIGAAVQNGVLAAWYADRSDNAAAPILQVIDTGIEEDLIAAYQRVVEEGAELVIGPLDRDRIRVILQQEQLSIPVLALNQISTDGKPTPVNSYQFGLSPNNELRQITNIASARKLHHSLVFRPKRESAQQLGAEFSALWLDNAEDNRLVAEVEYGKERQLSRDVERSLLLHQSERRSRVLQQVLGQRFHNEPRRRQDVDFAVLLAPPFTGRLLKPLLQFHRAGTVPVLALSRIHDGQDNPDRNTDLDGTQFPELPWLLEASELRQSVDVLLAPPELQRMHALGSSAYRLAQWLPRMSADPRLRLYGPTGLLQLNSNGHIQRHMMWATIRNGRVHVLPSHAALAPLQRSLDTIRTQRQR